MTLRKATAAVLLCTTLGCTAVRPVATPLTFIPQRAPDVVWVATEEGETFAILKPSIRGDSVVGTLASTSEPFGVPLSPGHVVFAKQKSSSKTAQLVGGLGLLAGLTVWGLIIAGNAERRCATPGMRGCPVT